MAHARRIRSARRGSAVFAFGVALVLVLAGAGAARAHAGEPAASAPWWTVWSIDPLSLLAVVSSGALYALGLVRLWRSAGAVRGASRAGVASFLLGWVALAIALVSPLHPLGQVLFSAHMAQHEVLMIVAAPLLVLARPGVVYLWALPRRIRGPVGRFFGRGRARLLWTALTAPLAAWTIHAVALWIWHVPVLFEATLRSDLVHAAQHSSFFLSALLFWWAILHAARRPGPQMASFASLFVTSLHTGLLGALLTFATVLWYPAYAATAPERGWTALEDQQLGGILMWIPAGSAYTLAALSLLARALRSLRSPAPAGGAATAGSLVLVLGVLASEPAHAAPPIASELAFVTSERAATLTVIDTDRDEVIATIPIGGRPRGVRVDPGGRFVYVAVSAPAGIPREAFPEGIAIVDPVAGKESGRLDVGLDPEQFVVSPDGRRLYVANEETAGASIVDIGTGEITSILPVGIEPEGVGVSPDGRWVYVTAETTSTVSAIDTTRADVIQNFLVDARPRDVVFSPDGAEAYVAAEIGGTVSVVDVASHRVVATIPMRDGNAAVNLSLSPDGKRLYVSNGHAHAVSVVDVERREVVGRFAVGQRPWGLAQTSDGRKLYAVNGLSNDVSVVDLATKEIVATIPVGERPWGVAIGRIGAIETVSTTGTAGITGASVR